MATQSRARFRVLPALVVTIGMTAVSPGYAACTAKSGAQTTALVELFTSEGCSSCPPADRWLSATFTQREHAHAIALAFHVDYWDRLGWKDRFASASYTDRQYQAMRANRATFVYTPQVLVQGKPIEDWNNRLPNRGAAPAIERANATAARAEISLEAVPRNDAIAIKAAALVTSDKDRRGNTLNVALVQSGLVSEVKAGENAGARLAHDHVVRAFRSGPLDAGGMGSLDVVLSVPADGATASAVVAFVQNSKSGEVLQAVELPLTAPPCAQ